MASFDVIGVYKVEVTRESITAAAKHYPWANNEIVPETGELREDFWQVYLEEQAEDKDKIFLVEVDIRGEYSVEDLNGFSHGPLEQAPWLEFYLDETGTNEISYEQAVSMDHRRVCFFMHFVEVDQPINILQGKKVVHRLPLPAITQLPERLQPLCFYFPYD